MPDTVVGDNPVVLADHGRSKRRPYNRPSPPTTDYRLPTTDYRLRVAVGVGHRGDGADLAQQAEGVEAEPALDQAPTGQAVDPDAGDGDDAAGGRDAHQGAGVRAAGGEAAD